VLAGRPETPLHRALAIVLLVAGVPIGLVVYALIA
jgi:hypothetical protein